MGRLLFIVEDTFELSGRGLVLVPGIVLIGDEQFRTGDKLRLKMPNQTEVIKQIAGLEFFTPPPRDHSRPVLIRDATKLEIPIGTEVWSV